MKITRKSNANPYPWRFFRAGGFDQVRIDTAKDLLALENLDQKLWVALACPADGVHFDKKTLALIDSNADGRIRAAELINAIKWTASLLANPEEMVAGSEALTVQSINESSPEGARLAAALRNALQALDRDHSQSISLNEICSLEKMLSDRPFNGDGVIAPAATSDPILSTIIEEILKTMHPCTDRSGKPGIAAEQISTFFEQIQAYCAWAGAYTQDTSVYPGGSMNESGAAALKDVEEKIDDYFTRCAVAQFDNQTLGKLNTQGQSELLGTTALFTADTEELKKLPLSKVAANASLDLCKGVNPAWESALSLFVSQTLTPLLGEHPLLTRDQWLAIKKAYAPWFAWQHEKPLTTIESLGIVRINELASHSPQTQLMALIEQDLAQSDTFSALVDLEKLVRFRRDLFLLAGNFVNFRDFYTKEGKAIFQYGTLFLDQRSCGLCVKVDDPAKHCTMAAMAGSYLVYCECRRPSAGEKMHIVAAFTNGDSENLMVGRNGLFYDRLGRDWDATITKIIENPISLRQAFWLPYKSLVRMIETQVAKRAQAADAESTDRFAKVAEGTAHADKGLTLAPPPAKKLDIGIVAALGVAAGALGTFIATLLGYASGIVRLGPLAIVGALIGAILLISGPSLVLAYIKLRKRNLGPILDGAGWAVNAKARVNVPFGAVLTQIATLPPGSQRDLTDPYAEKKSPWPRLIVVALVLYCVFLVLNHFGYVHVWTKGHIGKEKTTLVAPKDSPVSTSESAAQPAPATGLAP